MFQNILCSFQCFSVVSRERLHALLCNNYTVVIYGEKAVNVGLTRVSQLTRELLDLKNINFSRDNKMWKQHQSVGVKRETSEKVAQEMIVLN